MSADLGMHLMEVDAPARTVLRADWVTDEGVRVLSLLGAIRFAGAERVLHHLAEAKLEQETIAWDLTDVQSIDEVARRMLLEGMRRLRADGHTVMILDSDDVLPNPGLGEDEPIPVVGALPGA